MGRHRGKYRYPHTKRGSKEWIVIPQEMVEKFPYKNDDGQRTAVFGPGVLHRGVWRDHRYGANGLLAREYFEAEICPLCKAWSGLSFARIVPLDMAREMIGTITHHCAVLDRKGDLIGIDVCEKHYSTLTDLFWWQMKQRF